MTKQIEDLSPTPAMYQPQLVFIIGDFERRKELRKGVYFVPLDSLERSPEYMYTPRWRWIEGTFAADQSSDEPNPLKRVNSPTDAFFYFRARNKTLLVTKAIQDAIRSSTPNYDLYEQPEVSKHGGIIPYNHFLARRVRIDNGRIPTVFSMVVEEKPSSTSNLEKAVSAEFQEGADVFLVGIREPEEYLRIIQAWSGGTINPANYKRARFNQERFRYGKGGVLIPTHNY